MSLEQQAINTIRTLSIDAIQKANSGHPGLPMGAASMTYALWTHHLKHNPKNPNWFNRDRFILSAGHGSMLLYSLLYLTGYDVSLDDLKNFRQLGSKTPGHPEFGETPGVETTTGPLGQGASNAVGMALAEAYLANYFNRDGHKIVDHYTYALVSDGDIMEGVTMEASALAGHWGLGKLIYLYDSNDITLDGEAKVIFTENVQERYNAIGWNVITVEDGNDIEALEWAINEAKLITKKPSLIVIKTTIGFGSPNKAGTSGIHGSPLGTEEVSLTKAALGMPAEDFAVSDEVLNHWQEAIETGARYEAVWNKKFEAWKAEFPNLAAEWEMVMSGQLTDGWDSDIPVFPTGEAIATRASSGKVLNAIAKNIPTMIGGDADLAGSTKTLLSGEAHTGPGQPVARNLRFGIREHGMGAIVNGLALHGGIIRPYSATFLTFSDYMRGSIRLGAIMKIPSLYVFTHDSVGVGEDGPTHQPVEHVMSLRNIPNLYVFRPAEANETAMAWRTAMTVDGPAALIFTRQNQPTLEPNEDAVKGGYILADSDGIPDVILVASGSEVHIALEAYKTLTDEGVNARVVSLPCWELFDEQSDEYKERVLPSDVTARVSIEAGITLGWQKYTGLRGTNIGVDRFGMSAPYAQVYEALGLTAENVVKAAKRLL